MTDLLLGIDLGTTALKAAVFEQRSGKLLAGASKRLRVNAGPDGRREQDVPGVLRALRSALAELERETGDLRRLRGIGLAAQGGSTMIAKRATGKALTPMALWNDARAFPEFHALAASHPPRYWRAFSLRDEPGMGLARIVRMRREAPALLQAENIYAGAGEYVFFHLTGEWRQDAGNALQIGCYDARRGALLERAAQMVDAPLSFFAPLRRGHETHPLSSTAAKMFGLSPGIPVAGPYMDHEAGFLSVAQGNARPLQCSLGTAWVGNFVVPGASPARSPFQLVLPSPAGAGRLVVQPLLTGNVTWDWALSTFVGGNQASALAKSAAVFARSLLPARGLVALPWLNRPNPLDVGALGGGCFMGAGPSTTRGDMLRAVAAGMCYELARVFAEVKARKTIDSVVLSGGASKGPHFRTVIALLFAPLPVVPVEDEDWMGARGCLHAFNTKASQAQAKRPIAPGKTAVGPLLAGQALYEKAFAALYAHVAAGRAISFERGKKP
ncbi:MAG: FGGY-family carbohydrate kinase [Candidatus Hydrogenedentes bacterium]|nr:FGGY-family carbohydrate kinase [Candidatus Hydrogenedentota bacterium]